MGNAFSGITPRIKRRIIQKGGTELNFHYGLGGFKNPDKLRDEHLVDFLNDDAAVSPARVTRICLTLCTGITDKALIAIADTCHNLTWLSVTGCKNITGPGIDAIARKCRKLKTLWASDCNISYLPEDIGMLLPHLTFLHLFDNKIQKIPASLGRLADSLTLFYIDSNPLQQPPLEIVNQGLHAIQLYYDELDKGYKVSNIIQEVVLLG
jgi:Leucine-rich repeat (LRR) protein